MRRLGVVDLVELDKQITFKKCKDKYNNAQFHLT